MNPAPIFSERRLAWFSPLTWRPPHKMAATFLLNPAGLPEPLTRIGGAYVDGRCSASNQKPHTCTHVLCRRTNRAKWAANEESEKLQNPRM
jgi:hypothetical protein